MTIAALYVETNGCYFNLPNVEPWDELRDARKYMGPHPVVAHPPCQLWGNLAYVNYKRWGGEHNRPGNDGGCFAHALNCVRSFGGVLEHPAFTHAWKHFQLPRPRSGRWFSIVNGEWVCEVWQSAYGHKARKRTWLFYAGKNKPFDLNWERGAAATHQIGRQDKRGKHRNKPTIARKAASATPIEFRNALIALTKATAKPEGE